jgi:hypothetical protein
VSAGFPHSSSPKISGFGGGTLFDLDGKVLGKLPGSAGGHGVTVTGSGDIYVAQLSGVVQKFIKE